MSTWSTIATFASLTHPPANSLGPLESVTFAPVSARAFRLRATSVQRYSSAPVLIQVAAINYIDFIKQ